MIDGYDIDVELLALTRLVKSKKFGITDQPESEQIIEYAGRLCWGTTHKLGTNPKRIQNWIKVGHESVIEHASATFYIRASRTLTHELVRHRLASYSQRSQRYVKESEAKYIIPPDLNNTSIEAAKIFEIAMLRAWEAYNDLLRLGINREIARYVLPNACETEIIVTMNYRELRHFIKLRNNVRALPEMRAVAGEIKRIIKQMAPNVFNDL